MKNLKEVNNLNLKYDHFKKLLIVKSTGSVDTMDFIHAIKKLPIYLNGHPKLNVLLDLSDTEVRITINDLGYISDCLLKVVLPENFIRISNIVNRPIETALAILFKNIIKDRFHLEFEVFSTKSVALEWLNNHDR